MSPRVILIGFLCLGIVTSCTHIPENIPPRSDYQQIAHKISEAIAYEMKDKGIPGFSIALVDDQETVWAQGFGYAHPTRKQPATAQTVYRVASISKLFTALAIMQQVELGVLDLDVPIQEYTPELHPENPFHKPITLRQLLSHRAGIVREPPVGHYFDPTSPSLRETALSMNQTRLVYPPEMRTKYSNAGVTLAGYILQTVARQPFAEYMQQAVLGPLGMYNSSFLPLAHLRDKLAEGTMWTYDGRTFRAPVFELGIMPAANLYTTVIDLGHFLSAMFNKGQTPGKPLLGNPTTLDSMWTIQYAEPGQSSGFGLGFYLSTFKGKRRFQHSGVMYGYASRIYGLPDEKLGVAAVGTLDATNVITDRIATYALELMLAQREGRPLPDYPYTQPIDSIKARQLEGHYSSGSHAVEFIERNGNLLAFTGVTRNRVKQQKDTLVVDGRLEAGYRWIPTAKGIQSPGGTLWKRISLSLPAPPPEHWRAFIGEYGWPHNVLYILEKEGKLYALIEWFFYYPLSPTTQPDVFRMPDRGLYAGEIVHFTRDSLSQRVTGVRIGGVFWKRRNISPEEGHIFRIQPVRPLEEIRQEALQAQPPVQPDTLRTPDLVDLATLDPTLKLDIRYATAHNFMGTPLYREARAFLQQPAAEALLKAHRLLKKQGLGLIIHDAYRPWYVTYMMWAATPGSLKAFVASPDPGSRHNRGCAIDVSLYDLDTGKPVEMPSQYDEFTPRAFADYPGGTHRQRWYRERLRDAMEEAGFRVYPWEWWHFDYKDWRQYPVLNIPFDKIQ